MQNPDQWSLLKPIDADKFESICKDVLNEKYKDEKIDFDLYGRKGQSQAGIDIFATQGNGLIVAQCKNYLQNDAKALITAFIKDVNSIAKRIDLSVTKVILMTTHSRDKHVQDEILKNNSMLTSNCNFKIEVMFWENIQTILCGNILLLKKHGFPTGISQTQYHPESYRTKSRDQLEGWKTTHGKLYSVLYNDDTYIPMTIKDDKKEYVVEDVLTKLKDKNCHHAILIGEGGMGKTTTCIRLWDTCLKQNMQVFYVPLCDYTTENAIKKTIVNVYGVEKNNYNRLTNEENVVLLLDGFNEMKTEYNQNFLTELRELSTKKYIQILITSRNYALPSETSGFTQLSFESLDKKAIDEWLSKHAPDNKKTVLTSELYKILGNPMLLKIYAHHIKEIKTLYNVQKTIFLKDPITVGEIIWNFLEHQIIKSTATKETEGLTKILYRYLLPYIAYRIESQEKFHFTPVELESYIDDFGMYVEGIYKKSGGLITLKAAVQAFLNRPDRTAFLLGKCVNSFSIIKLEHTEGLAGDVYSFIHHYFRDIFSATHIKNQMTLQDKSVFTSRELPLNIYRMLSEILQEHQVKKQPERKYEWLKPSGEVSELRQYLKCFKNDTDRETQIGVFNALQIFAYSRNDDLSDEDFSELDLRKCRFIDKDISESKFREAYVSKQVFFSTDPKNYVWNACFSPDEKYSASASQDMTIKILDNHEKNKVIHTLKSHTDYVLNMCFNPDGKTLASASRDKTVKIWDIENGKLLQTLKMHNDSVLRICYSPDGKTLASASRDKTVKIWDIENGKLLQTLHHTDHIYDIIFSPEKTLATASDDNVVRVWDIVNKKVRILKGHTGPVYGVSYSSDGKYLASASRDKTVRVWDIVNKKVRILKGHTDPVECVCFNTDGKTLVTTSQDKTVKIWNIENGKLLQTPLNHTDYLYDARFSKDGKKLVTISQDRSVRIWVITKSGNYQLFFTTRYIASMCRVCFSSDGTILATTSRNRAVKLWNSDGNENYKLFRILEGHKSVVYSVCFSSDGKTLAAASMDGTIKIWNSESGELLQPSLDHTDYLYDVRFSQDGKALAAASRDKTVRIWNSKNGDLIHTLPHTDSVLGICYSKDGNTLASASMDGTIKIWNSESGNLLYTLKKHQDSVWCVCFSPDSSDGNTLASASMDGTIRVWDIVNKKVRILKGHTGPVYGVSYSSDGKYLASASRDKTVRVWDIVNKKVRILKGQKGHKSSVECVWFSPKDEDKTLATASDDNTVRVWDLDAPRLIKTLYPLGHLKVLRADFKGINYGDLTETDKIALKQNGVITD